MSSVYDAGILQLETLGVTSLPLLDPEELPGWREEFLETCRGFPEYRRSPEDPDCTPEGDPVVYVLGGFAAFGNPGSFHNPFVRDLRWEASQIAQPFFEELCQNRGWEGYRLQCLPDRMMYRLGPNRDLGKGTKGQTPTAEAWHRDVQPSKRLTEGDDIFGGWINLDSEPQFFSFIPGSHRIRFDTGETDLAPGEILALGVQDGFAKLEQEVPDKEEREEIIAQKQRFQVDPGAMVIFPQYILHEVVANSAKSDMFRLFTGWRLTRSRKMLAQESDFTSQGIIRLPGGMQPPMFAQNHLINFQTKAFNVGKGPRKSLLEWSEQFIDVALEQKSGKIGEYVVVQRHMSSLQDLEVEMYEEYTEEEMQIYRGLLLSD